MHLYSKKGYDLHLDDTPSEALDTVRPSKYIKLHPGNFLGIKPKLLVSEGDSVKQGQPIYFDKKQPDVMFTTAVAGSVGKIVYGDRRVIKSIDIQVSNSEHKISFSKNEFSSIKSISREKVIEILCSSGCWPYIRKRPFSKIPSPESIPDAIFITTISTAPYSPSIKVIHDSMCVEDVQAGIDALSCLGDMPIHMVLPHSSNYPAFDSFQNIHIHTFEGPHPSGNVGYHIANIHPIENKESNVWYIALQDLISIGKLLLTGNTYDKKIISIGGSPDSDNNRHVLINRGVLVSDILLSNSIDEDYRVISGDVLSGENVSTDSAIGFYHDTVSILKNSFNREFMGWITPGFSKYSISRTFLSSLFPKRNIRFSTAMNGGVRAIVPIGFIEKMCNLDILPTMLIKSIIAKDIETMEELGIYECASEDFALCSFVDASKMDIVSIIQAGLDYAEAEG